MKKYCLIFAHDSVFDLPQFYDTYEEAYNAMKEKFIAQIEENVLDDVWPARSGELREEEFHISEADMFTRFPRDPHDLNVNGTDAKIFVMELTEKQWKAENI